MQDGALANYLRAVTDWLNTNYARCWMGRNGPARSPDLNPCDYFLWRRIKELVYKTPIENQEEALIRFQQAFQSLTNEEIFRATHGIVQRTMACYNVRGKHLNNCLISQKDIQ